MDYLYDWIPRTTDPGDDEREAAVDPRMAELRARFTLEDWVNGDIDYRSLEGDEYRELCDWIFSELAERDFRFPPVMDEKQRAWPAEIEISEAEIRSELHGMLNQLKTMAARAEELYEKLPEISDDEVEEVVPMSVCSRLRSLLGYLSEELDGVESYTEQALAETPAELRARWVELNVPARLKDLLPAEMRELGG